MIKGKYKHSEEAKRRMSEAHKGIRHTEESKKKISEANKGKKRSEESKKKMSDKRKGRKHTEETKRKMSDAHKGENNINWKGGISKENESIRTSHEYKLWRKACKERDNFICQKTGISGGRLEVHHIHNFADYPELRLAIDNGITLSKKAHKDFHKIYGKKNNTKEQLLEFLTNNQ